MSLYVNRIRYKGGSPTLAASSGIINNAVLNGHDFYDDDYNPTPPAHDYSQDYFTIESLTDGNTIKLIKGGRYTPAIYYYYSLDNGSTWTGSEYEASWVLNSGDKILFKGNNNRFSRGTSTTYSWYFHSTDSCILYGNIMSLLYGDDFVGKTSLKDTYSFSYLFYGNSRMFTDISNLILPATTLSNYCYYRMFQYATSGTVAPKLPATTLKPNCYQEMFFGCSNLNYITCLATDISASNCLSVWLESVSATGTFIKNPSMSSWPSGASGIPTSWTVEDYVE